MSKNNINIYFNLNLQLFQHLNIFFNFTHREFNGEANSKEVSKAFTSLEVDLSFF